MNLNKARKAKARAEKSAQADVNAVKFGRTKAQKDSARKEADRALRALHNHKRDP
ncbi:DUF4169 family protein [Pseudosulfitobacter pseudonitzschiae]|uniref:DUF4169 family protein n=1 Tax=Pseudosulfitobacter pseudonitzschiae TaxID=1402135 RepID=UPI003B7746F4